MEIRGQEHIDDLGLNWDSYKWRNHQPDIGRFFNVDRMSEDYYYNSPYAFSENKVTSHKELEGLEARRSISAQEVNGQWTMGSDNNISLEIAGKQKLDAMATGNDESSSRSNNLKALVGTLENVSSISSLDRDRPSEGTIAPSLPSLSVISKMKGTGVIALSAVNVALGVKDLTRQADEKGWGNVNKMDAAQVTVGTVGTIAATLEWAGFGSASISTVAVSANVVGLVLSIPGNWNQVYKGAVELSSMPPTTGDIEADHLLQLQYEQGFQEQDYFQN